MAKRRVVVKGGGANLYEISDSGGKFWCYKISVGLISNSRNDIGTARSLEDALAIIRSHSGKDIQSID